MFLSICKQVESVTISDDYELMEHKEKDWNASSSVSHTEPVKEVSQSIENFPYREALSTVSSPSHSPNKLVSKRYAPLSHSYIKQKMIILYLFLYLKDKPNSIPLFFLFGDSRLNLLCWSLMSGFAIHLLSITFWIQSI